MLAALLVAHLHALALGACPAGAIRSCTLAGCCVATQECVGTTWDACTCEVPVGQTCGAATQCATYKYNSSCQCVATVNTGAACNDANACTTNDRCDAAGTCAGSMMALDDGNPCTLDKCDPAIGITHQLANTSASTCSSATYFCYDKYGNVTKKVVCVAGSPCDTSCP